MKPELVNARALTVLVGVILIGMAVPAHGQVDLGDIAVGGDGTGSAPVGTGLRITNGQLVPATQFGGSSYHSSPFFVRTDGSNGTANLPYVDGVFLPRGTSQISSTNLTFPFPQTGGARWDALRNAAAVYEPDVNPPLLHMIHLADNPGVNRRGLGIHTNSGITFDLAALRNAGKTFDAVQGVAGLNLSVGGWPGDFELWVLVDGVQRYHQTFINGGLTYEPFTLSIGPADQYLTFAATDYDHSNTADHAVIADLQLVPEPTALVCACAAAAFVRRRHG